MGGGGEEVGRRGGSGGGAWKLARFFSKLMPDAKLPLETTKPPPRVSAIIDRSYVRSLFERGGWAVITKAINRPGKLRGSEHVEICRNLLCAPSNSKSERLPLLIQLVEQFFFFFLRKL